MFKILNEEPRTIYDCFKLLYKVLYYTGCVSFKQKDGKLVIDLSSIIYTYIVRVILIVGFVGGFALKLNDKDSAQAMFGRLTPVTKFILTFECLANLITYIEATLMIDAQKRNLIQLMSEFEHLDRSLQIDYPFIKWNYQKTMRKYAPTTIAIFIYFSIVSLSYVFNLSGCYCGIPTTFLIGATYTSITVATGSVGFIHIAKMDLLRLRYRLISHLAQQTSNSSGTQNQKSVITNLKLYCRKYTELIININNVFGYVSAAGIFHDFSILTSLLFLLCQKASTATTKTTEYTFVILLLLPHFYKLVMTAIYGYLTEEEQKKCLHILMIRQTDDQEWFLHWKTHNNYKLYIGSTIRCNLNVIYMVLHGITNYVIILIQLQFQENTITNNMKNHESPKNVEYVKL
ncbi:putative gustatory receptor 47b [Teleopsis dalmanni]|uniref:putative gustatory receptor 47b n=1 Tax=Teleopsis dalmanni TaxID=139649 RepID=UPI0018CF29C1|nr:putative gustatory receptor 47b [Teleopsis dalmanni]